MKPIIAEDGGAIIEGLKLSPDEWKECLLLRDVAFDRSLFLLHKMIRHSDNEILWLETSGNGELTFGRGGHKNYTFNNEQATAEEMIELDAVPLENVTVLRDGEVVKA